MSGIHALSGCDIVPKMCGTGKVSALKIIAQNPQVPWII